MTPDEGMQCVIVSSPVSTLLLLLLLCSVCSRQASSSSATPTDLLFSSDVRFGVSAASPPCLSQ